ncbi:hypothetical protein Sjap_015484 [Stephania japonica]|uniref:K+ potassium transporter integral membrane domain-containing protein n=1 Tax=Stephania japonica TaxID=461633 RepID=A0AAP0IL49_9MAGN
MGQTPLVLDHHIWHSMVIGDGVLTPCISVLSAVSGIKQSAKSLNQDAIVGISVCGHILTTLLLLPASLENSLH